MPATLNYSSDLYTNPSRLNALDRRAHWPLRFGLAGIFGWDCAEKLPEIISALQSASLPEDAATLVAAAQLITATLIVVGGVFGNFITRTGALIGIPTLLTGAPLSAWADMGLSSETAGSIASQPDILVLSLLAYFMMSRGPTARV